MTNTAQLPQAFYEQDGDRFVATPMTRGPWDDRFQHGGPPAALLAGAIERFDGADEYRMARISIELLKPVPIAALQVELGPVLGRTVQRIEARLEGNGETLMIARGLRIRRAPLIVPALAAPPPWPAPDALEDYVFSFFRSAVGYHRAIQLKVAYGAWGTTPVGFWARPRIPLVAGKPTSSVESLLVLADAQSGMGVPLDPLRYTFLNPDLTVYFERRPVAGWFGFDIRSTANADGAGLAQSAVRDARGLVARSAQSLVVVERPLPGS